MFKTSKQHIKRILMLIAMLFMTLGSVFCAYGAEPVLGGDELMMLGSQTIGQMMSYVITTRSGQVIVVDGGNVEDAEYLKNILISKGGHVSAWFITHPHSDHAGALYSLLSAGTPGLTIDNIYYHFLPIEQMRNYESYRADFAEAAAGAIAASPAARVTTRDQMITVDDVTVKVLNDPGFYENHTINNSSVAYMMTFGNGKKMLFLGDMGEEAGDRLLAERGGELKADLVQMAHHGQDGVGENLYLAVKPSICMWNAPDWLYTNRDGYGNYRTLEVRQWMENMGVRINYNIANGDQVIK